jgi:rhamnosyl/mannosyltransferase
MRVLQVGKYYQPDVGGIERHVGILARGLRARDVEVEVVVHHHGRRTVRETVDGVTVTRVGTLGRILSTEVSPTLVAEMSRDYDVVHLHTPHPMGMLAYLLSRKPRHHLLVVTHHSDIVRQARLRAVLAPLFDSVMTRAGVIISGSKRYVETSSELAPHRAKVRIIPFGLELSKLPFLPRQSAGARELRARYAGPITFALGRLIYYKGFQVLIDAFARVPGTLLLGGEGPLRPALEEQAERRGLRNRIRFVGAIPEAELAAYYGAADVFVLPSIARSEAFGIVQIEALAAGVPVVNTALDSGVPEVSLDGVTGFTVPADDPHALAAAMNRVLGDPETAIRLSGAARSRAMREYDADRMVDSTVAAYREALQLASEPRTAPAV